MADATVTQGRREEALPLAKESAPIAAPRLPAIGSLPLKLLWAGIVGAVAAFLAFGTVRVGAGNWTGLRMSVRRIWGHFTRFLAEEGASAAVSFGVLAAALIALLGSAVVLWLAFAMKDLPDDPPPGDIAAR